MVYEKPDALHSKDHDGEYVLARLDPGISCCHASVHLSSVPKGTSSQRRSDHLVWCNFSWCFLSKCWMPPADGALLGPLDVMQDLPAFRDELIVQRIDMIGFSEGQ